MTIVFTRPLALVTGASSGIGYELAKQFAEHGYDLIIVSEDAGIVEAKQAFEGMGAAVESFQVDLSTFEGVDSFASKVKAFGTPIEALALNAGVGVGGAFIGGTSLEEEMAMIRLNVQSVVHLSKLLIPDMVARRQGKVLFTSSLASTAPGPYYAVYAASKAFVQSFAEALRFEVKDSGVTITSLMPGATDTNFFSRAHMEDTKAGAGPKDDPALVAKEGFQALMDGKDHILAGALKNKLQGSLGKALSDPIKASMQAKETRPGSGH